MANTITQTTVSGSFNQNASSFTVASATNLTAPVSNFRQAIYVINPGQTKGELMDVVGLSGTQVSVARSSLFRQSFYTGSIVVIAPSPNAAANFGGNFNGSFFETDPVGNPSVAASYPGAPVVTPWLNATNGLQWLQDVNGVWQPGWNNPGSVSGPTTLVSSAAGAILPSGRLFHVDGTAAVTGFTIPTGFAGGSFSIIPDGNFTWTTAGNIGLAGTAVTGRLLTFQYDTNVAKFWPSYV
jgi:hypothetical protein